MNTAAPCRSQTMLLAGSPLKVKMPSGGLTQVIPSSLSRVQGQVAAVVVLQCAPILILGHPVAVDRAFIGARNVQPRNLVVALRDAPVRTHPAHVPHAVLAEQVVVQHGAVQVDAPAHARPAVLPRLVAVRLHQHAALASDLHLAANAALLLEQRLVQQQDAVVAITGSTHGAHYDRSRSFRCASWASRGWWPSSSAVPPSLPACLRRATRGSVTPKRSSSQPASDSTTPAANTGR